MDNIALTTLYDGSERILRVSKTDITASNVDAIIKAIPQNGSLKSLELSETKGSPAEYDKLLEQLSKNAYKLQSLKKIEMNTCDVGGNNSIEAIVSFLKKLPALESVDFSNNCLDDNNIKPLQDFVASNKNIKKLNIEESSLTDDGVRPFLPLLSNPFHGLVELKVADGMGFVSSEMEARVGKATIEKRKKISSLNRINNNKRGNIDIISQRNKKNGR